MEELVRSSFWAHLGSIWLFEGLPCSRIVRAELIFDASLFPLGPCGIRKNAPCHVRGCSRGLRAVLGVLRHGLEGIPNTKRTEASISLKRSGAKFSDLVDQLAAIQRPDLMAESNRVLVLSTFPRGNPNGVRDPARLICVVKRITTTVLNGERSLVWKITAGRRPACSWSPFGWPRSTSHISTRLAAFMADRL